MLDGEAGGGDDNAPPGRSNEPGPYNEPALVDSELLVNGYAKLALRAVEKEGDKAAGRTPVSSPVGVTLPNE